MLERLITSMLPSSCLLCDQPLAKANACASTPGQLCIHCYTALPWNRPCCPTCATPLQSDQACAACRDQRPPFTRAIAPLRFEAMVQTWLHKLKFHHGAIEARVLGGLLAAAVQDGYRAQSLPEVIVPVPLSLRRLARRGHNQALTIATRVAGRLGLPLARVAVRRTRHTPPQTARGRDARQRNLAEAFTSKAWCGTRVAVVDDVMTTGATAAEMAQTILDAGATDVHIWVTARTPPP